jgi:adenine deaminase
MNANKNYKITNTDSGLVVLKNGKEVEIKNFVLTGVLSNKKRISEKTNDLVSAIISAKLRMLKIYGIFESGKKVIIYSPNY